MPLSAAASAREILTGLHDIMGARGSAQSKLDKVVDLIAEKMGSEVCSIYLLRDNKLDHCRIGIRYHNSNGTILDGNTATSMSETSIERDSTAHLTETGNSWN